MAKTRSPELEPFDRLEDKVKRLVALVERLRTEQTQAAEENQRLTGELDALRTKLADAQQSDSEVSTMREEREQIRTRVADMLERLETIDL